MTRAPKTGAKRSPRRPNRAYTQAAAMKMAALYALGFTFSAVVSTFKAERVAPPSKAGFYNVIAREKAGTPLTGGVKQPIVTQGTIDLVEKLINEDPRRYAREIEELLFSRHHLVVSHSTVLTVIHNNLDLTKTKLDIRAAQRQTVDRMRLLAAYSADGFDSRMAIWIDESHVTPDSKKTGK